MSLMTKRAVMIIAGLILGGLLGAYLSVLYNEDGLLYFIAYPVGFLISIIALLLFPVENKTPIESVKILIGSIATLLCLGFFSSSALTLIGKYYPSSIFLWLLLITFNILSLYAWYKCRHSAARKELS